MNLDRHLPSPQQNREEEIGEPLVVAPNTAWRMLDCSVSHGYALLRAGELESFLSGRSKKITVASIRAYIARQLAARA
jgi:hypothetical protein